MTLISVIYFIYLTLGLRGDDRLLSERASDASVRVVDRAWSFLGRSSRERLGLSVELRGTIWIVYSPNVISWIVDSGEPDL